MLLTLTDPRGHDAVQMLDQISPSQLNCGHLRGAYGKMHSQCVDVRMCKMRINIVEVKNARGSVSVRTLPRE